MTKGGQKQPDGSGSGRSGCETQTRTKETEKTQTRFVTAIVNDELSSSVCRRRRRRRWRDEGKSSCTAVSEMLSQLHVCRIDWVLTKKSVMYYY